MASTRTKIVVAAAICAGLLGLGISVIRPTPDQHIAALTAQVVTPPGVTLRDTRGTRSPAGVLLPGPLAYADPEGTLAYIFAKDVAGGQPTCTDTCAETWRPLAAPIGAQPFGDWSVVGAGQWAYKGNPLYVTVTPKPDDDYKTCAPPRHDVAALPGAYPADWCVAEFAPATDLILPDGITLRSNANANGMALADSAGLTLYTFNGDMTRDGQGCILNPCARAWSPLAAPELALQRGDFDIARRADGTPQWAYKGRALYTYQGDGQPGDVNGVGVDDRWTVAAIALMPTPPGVGIRYAAGIGTIWTEAHQMTLYTHNHGGEARRGPGRAPLPPDSHCDAACQAVWRPFMAEDGAQASGYWTLTALDGGGKQWAYRGSPVFTFTGDAHPGDVKGKYTYRYVERDADGQIVKINLGIPNSASPDDLPDFWRPAFPY